MNKIDIYGIIRDIQNNYETKGEFVSNIDGTENAFIRQPSIISFQKDLNTDRDKPIRTKNMLNDEGDELIKDDNTDNGFGPNHESSFMRLIRDKDNNK